MRLQRFSLNTGIALGHKPCMTPDSNGDWVQYKEVIKLKDIRDSVVTCGHKVEIEGSEGRAHTYCMLDVGHEGKCSSEKRKGEKHG